MSISETYTLAHTAQCKLQMAADRPNRNLRFILGHAFTLDKVMCRIVEIENMQESTKADRVGQTESCGVTFKDNSDRPTGPLRREMNPSTKKGAKGGRARSPPPEPHAVDREDSSDSDEYMFDEDEDADDPSLSLSKTTSHIAQQPPNLIPSDGDSSDEDDDPVSPPAKPSDSVLETIIEEEGDETLAELYDGIRRCSCQNDVDKQAPPVSKVWELPQSEVKKSGKGMKQTRTLLVAVQA